MYGGISSWDTKQRIKIEKLEAQNKKLIEALEKILDTCGESFIEESINWKLVIEIANNALNEAKGEN